MYLVRLLTFHFCQVYLYSFCFSFYLISTFLSIWVILCAFCPFFMPLFPTVAIFLLQHPSPHLWLIFCCHSNKAVLWRRVVSAFFFPSHRFDLEQTNTKLSSKSDQELRCLISKQSEATLQGQIYLCMKLFSRRWANRSTQKSNKYGMLPCMCFIFFGFVVIATAYRFYDLWVDLGSTPKDWKGFPAKKIRWIKPI